MPRKQEDEKINMQQGKKKENGKKRGKRKRV